MMSADKWSCGACTYLNPETATKCVVCDTAKPVKSDVVSEPPFRVKKKELPKREKREIGRVLYQIDRVTEKQLRLEHEYFAQKQGCYRVFLFGDNDIDKGRLESDKREYLGGLAAVCGPFDRSVAFGLITVWYAFSKPSFDEFRQLMDDQFNDVFRLHLCQGRDVVVPCPSASDLSGSRRSYFESLHCRDGLDRSTQVVYHNIGTGIAGLDLPFLKYIQFKIDTLERLSRDPASVRALAVGAAAEAGSAWRPGESAEVFLDGGWRFAQVLGSGSSGYIVKVRDERTGEESFPLVKPADIRALVEVERDEWEDANEFVFTQYILDLRDLFANPFDHLDEIMALLERMGVRSLQSKSRALEILSRLKNDEMESLSRRKAQQMEAEAAVARRKEAAGLREFEDAELAKMVAGGRFMKEFCCPQCFSEVKLGGIELQACHHPLCDPCFRRAVDSAVSESGEPKCVVCETPFDSRDVHVHYSPAKLAELSERLFLKRMEASGDLYRCFSKGCDGMLIIEERTVDDYTCPKCGSNNCCLCKAVHRKGHCPKRVRPAPSLIVRPPKFGRGFSPRHRTEYLNNVSFFGHWQSDEELDLRRSRMCVAITVQLGSQEWHNCVSYIEDPTVRTVLKIERIQHAKLWRSYVDYCENGQFGAFGSDERAVWHGTRAHSPSKIWQKQGFDLRHAKIGGCLWFAIRNTYSMGGFEHPMSDGSGNKQIFLALVACGNSSDCKFIRNNEILNVYKNEATYPAYLVTYRDGGPGIGEQKGIPV